MTTSHWTSALTGFLDVVLADLAALVRECPDDVWETEDVGRHQGPRLGTSAAADAREREPRPRGVDPHSAVWYAALHLVYTLDWNFSARASSWEPPPPFRKGDLDAGRLPQRTYTREESLSYMAYVHEKTRATLAAVAGDEATLAGHGRTSADWLVAASATRWATLATSRPFSGSTGDRRLGACARAVSFARAACYCGHSCLTGLLAHQAALQRPRPRPAVACAYCGAVFTARPRRAKFCGKRCKENGGYRRRRAAGETPAIGLADFLADGGRLSSRASALRRQSSRRVFHVPLGATG